MNLGDGKMSQGNKELVLMLMSLGFSALSIAMVVHVLWIVVSIAFG
jgi:hypothetical protein